MPLENTAAPSTWLAERTKIDSNWDKINGMKLVLSAQNDASQFRTTPVGTEETINYGTANILETDYVTFDGETVGFVMPGLYRAEAGVQVARTSGQQTSSVLIRTIFTPNGGAAIPGKTRWIELDDDDTSIPVDFERMFTVNAGDTFVTQFVKDGGHPTIQLDDYAPVTPGWANTSSAYVLIWKLNED